MTHHARLNLSDCFIRSGLFGTYQLVGRETDTGAPFRAQVFASQGTAFTDTATAWTAAGKVRCKGGIDFPRAS